MLICPGVEIVIVREGRETDPKAEHKPGARKILVRKGEALRWMLTEEAYEEFTVSVPEGDGWRAKHTYLVGNGCKGETAIATDLLVCVRDRREVTYLVFLRIAK